MTPWPSWSPPSPSTEAPPRRPRRRWRAWLAVAAPVVSAGIHAGLAVAAAGGTARPVRVIVAASPDASTRVERVTNDAPTTPVDPGSPHQALLRTYARVAVNPARPAVILAWNHQEVAYTDDDGATWTRSRVPGTDRTDPPVGTVTGDGAGLLSIGLQGWLRFRRGTTEHVIPPASGVVTRWASDGRWTFAFVREPEVERVLVSRDHGATWRTGPAAPEGAYGATLLADGRLAVSYAWSAGCGGGAEGVSTWTPGDTEWTAVAQPHVGHLTRDLHVLAEGCDGSPADVLCAWAPGPQGQPAVGPSLARVDGARVWFATGPSGSYAGAEGRVYRVEAGAFRLVDAEAPVSLDHVVVDGRGRLVGIANGHVVRWTPPAAGEQGDPADRWRVHVP